jgi:hypothetical protein
MSGSKERFGLLAPGLGGPREGLCVAHNAACGLHFWDNIDPVCILGTDNVGSGEQGCNCNEQ